MSLLALAKAILDDDHGVSEEAYDILRKMSEDNAELSDLLRKVEATDGRYYLPYSH